MAAGKQRNFRIQPDVSEALDRLRDELNSKGGRVWPSEVAGAALALFFRQDRKTQIALIRCARSFDLEIVESRAGAAAGAADQLVDDSVAPPQAEQPTDSKKKRKKKGA